jgi:uncharacterized protein (DUF4415 family)
MPTQKYGVPDDENPEWTAEDWANARPGREVLPTAFVREVETEQRRGRGPQKAPTKRLVSVRLDVSVLERFRATGKGWQTRINDTLAAHAPRPRRTQSRTSKAVKSRRAR